MIPQLLFTINVILISFTLRSEAVTDKINCTVEDDTVKQGIQNFYCIAVKVYDELETVSTMYGS